MNTRNSNISFGDEASVEAERNRRLQVFRQSYESLVSLVSLLVHYFGNSALVVSLVKGQSYCSVPVVVKDERCLEGAKALVFPGCWMLKKCFLKVKQGVTI